MRIGHYTCHEAFAFYLKCLNGFCSLCSPSGLLGFIFSLLIYVKNIGALIVGTDCVAFS